MLYVLEDSISLDFAVKSFSCAEVKCSGVYGDAAKCRGKIVLRRSHSV